MSETWSYTPLKTRKFSMFLIGENLRTQGVNYFIYTVISSVKANKENESKEKPKAPTVEQCPQSKKK